MQHCVFITQDVCNTVYLTRIIYATLCIYNTVYAQHCVFITQHMYVYTWFGPIPVSILYQFPAVWKIKHTSVLQSKWYTHTRTHTCTHTHTQTHTHTHTHTHMHTTGSTLNDGAGGRGALPPWGDLGSVTEQSVRSSLGELVVKVWG